MGNTKCSVFPIRLVDDSSKGVIAVAVGEAKVYLMDQLSTTVSRQ